MFIRPAAGRTVNGHRAALALGGVGGIRLVAALRRWIAAATAAAAGLDSHHIVRCAIVVPVFGSKRILHHDGKCDFCAVGLDAQILVPPVAVFPVRDALHRNQRPGTLTGRIDAVHYIGLR